MSSAGARILVVEDDLPILTGVSINLRYEGYEVLQAQDGKRGLELALKEEPDLIVLDIMLPEMNGYEVLTELRRRGREFPVIVLSARGLESDKILGLTLGADDYIGKPFGVAELLARIKAVLRRRQRQQEMIRFGDVEVDMTSKRVLRGGKEIELTAQEFRLLTHFVSHPSRIFARDELLQAAWGMDYEGTERTVDNFVRQLRMKLEPNPDEPRHFQTVRGLGYRFDV